MKRPHRSRTSKPHIDWPAWLQDLAALLAMLALVASVGFVALLIEDAILEARSAVPSGETAQPR